MRRVLVALTAGLVLAPTSWGATTATAPVYDSKGHLVQTPYAPANASQLTKKKASDIFLHDHKVSEWLKHYPRVVTYDATYSAKDRNWTVHVWSGAAGEVAQGKVDEARAEAQYILDKDPKNFDALLLRAATVRTQEDVTAARARGLSDGRIRTAYVGRNAVLPLVTQLAISVGFIVGGAAVIEQLFAYQGVGKRLLDSVTQRDYPVIQGVVLLTTISVVVANLAADLLYSKLDPRIGRAGGAAG